MIGGLQGGAGHQKDHAMVRNLELSVASPTLKEEEAKNWGVD